MPRLRNLYMTPELIANLGSGRFEVIASPVPETARVVGCGYSSDKKALYVTLEDDTFEDINTAHGIPEHPRPRVRRIEG